MESLDSLRIDLLTHLTKCHLENIDFGCYCHIRWILCTKALFSLLLGIELIEVVKSLVLQCWNIFQTGCSVIGQKRIMDHCLVLLRRSAPGISVSGQCLNLFRLQFKNDKLVVSCN